MEDKAGGKVATSTTPLAKYSRGQTPMDTNQEDGIIIGTTNSHIVCT